MLGTVYKIFACILSERINISAEKVLGEYQCGFRKGRSTTDHIFTMRSILEKFYENNLDLHQLYVDFAMAYDTVSRVGLVSCLKVLGVPFKIIRLIRMTLSHTVAKVMVQGELSCSFPISQGLRQGDPMSPVLFNLVLEMAVRNNSTTSTSGSIYNRTVQYLAYADDVAIIARSAGALKDAFADLESGAAPFGLKVNELKTKYLVTTRRARRYGNLQASQHSFEGVKSFKYLGATLTSKNEIREDIINRIAAANRCLWALSATLRNRNVSRKAKIVIYKTIIKPVLLYGSETWTLTAADERALRCWERKVLRIIYGPVVENGTYRSRKNAELMALYEEADVVKGIKIGRLRWLGHLHRMEEGRAPRKAYEGHPGGRRPRGRPRLKWLEKVEEDLDKLRVRQWRRKAMDRSDWDKVLSEAKALQGL